MAKGPVFERQVCTQLSLWWTDGLRDDIFWRTAGSGARATTRKKSGKDTANSYGDVGWIDPIGEPFLKAFSVSLKRGYARFSIHDLLDKPDTAKEQEYEQWFREAADCSIYSLSLSWMLIARRDRRKALVFMPYATFNLLISLGSMQTPRNCLELTYLGRDGLRIVSAVTLDYFLERCNPEHVRRMVKGDE